MNLFFKSKFSQYKLDFGKHHSTQNVLLNMVEHWKRALDRGTVFMNLSKMFNTLLAKRYLPN